MLRIPHPGAYVCAENVTEKNFKGIVPRDKYFFEGL
jgi:hypothetical protein